MAELKKLISLDNLTSYDTLIKKYVDDADAVVNAKSIKTVLVDGDNIKFYKKENATATDTADYTVAIASSDVDNLKKILSGFTTEGSVKDAIDANATAISTEAERADAAEKANKKAIEDEVTRATGVEAANAKAISDEETRAKAAEAANEGAISAEVTRAKAAEEANASAIAAEKSRAEAAEGDLDTAVKAAQKTADDITTLVGTIPASSEAETVTAYVDEQVTKATGDAKKVADDLSAYETANDARVKTVEDDIDALEGRATALETAVGTVADLDTTSKEVVGAINELVEALEDAQEAGEVSMVEAVGTDNVLKSYTFYQGEQKEANKIGTINIPKDLVVTSGEVVKDPSGQPKGTYIKLTIANQEAPIFINVLDLVNDFTVEQSAAQVQLAISETREISAEIVDGSVDTDALGASAVTTAKIADENVTKAKLSADVQATLDKADGAAQAITDAIEALDSTKSQTAGADGLALEVVEEDGKITSISGSIAANTYDAYGEAKKVQDDLDSYKYDVATATDINKLFSDEEA